MLQGDPLRDGWRSAHVREALDLCLSCKGCKSDCPMQVDMATYKAEFLAHHYAGRLRPRQAYTMGLISWWARLAALMPGVANVVTQTPGLRHIAQWLGGIAPQRRLPAFAPQTFMQWFRQRGLRNVGRPKVLLWPDTFTNYFFPAVGQAAVDVLEAAGYQVDIPSQALCCGRPLYDFGMLRRAKRLLSQILDTLRPQIEAGVPIVGLEPSCVAVFRDELGNLFPHDEDAKRLSQRVYLLSEFLVHAAEGYQPPQLHRRAIVHGHCHHKAIMGMDAETEILSRLGLDYRVLDSGCCGMAGSFGFEAGHYEVSLAIGEHELLPAVRQADKETLIIADGFSCREQIAQTTDRQALHLAQVMQMALHDGPPGPAGDYPEAHARRPEAVPQAPSRLTTAALVGVGALAGGLMLWGWRQARRH
jgi:Fe-S oxidoreductase